MISRLIRFSMLIINAILFFLYILRIILTSIFFLKFELQFKQLHLCFSIKKIQNDNNRIDLHIIKFESRLINSVFSFPLLISFKLILIKITDNSSTRFNFAKDSFSMSIIKLLIDWLSNHFFILFILFFLSNNFFLLFINDLRFSIFNMIIFFIECRSSNDNRNFNIYCKFICVFRTSST